MSSGFLFIFSIFLICITSLLFDLIFTGKWGSEKILSRFTKMLLGATGSGETKGEKEQMSNVSVAAEHC